MRILLADDEPKVRQALRLLLEQQNGVTVIGEAGQAWEALAQLGAHAPDVLLPLQAK